MNAPPKKKGIPGWVWIVAVLVLLPILALVGLVVAGMVMGAATYGELHTARTQSAETQARMIAAAALLWTVEHPERTCPSTGDLVSDGALSPSTATTDPWGRSYRVECDGSEVSVRSAGPDGVAGTEDDVVAR